MMASRGLIGLAGGLGAALNDNAAFLGRQEERQQTFADNVKLQGWLQQMRTDAQIATEQRAEDRKNAPYKRFEGLMAAAAGEDVPVTAAPVSSLAGGQGTTADGAPLQTGFTGDLRSAQAAVASMAEGPDKVAAQAQLQGQLAAEQQSAQAAVAGQTRKRTSAEALQAARERAMATDLQASSAFETGVGKTLRDEERLDNQARRDDARTAAAGAETARKERADERRFQTELMRLDLQGQSLEAQNRKIDAMIEHWGNQDDAKAAGAGKAGSTERMYSLLNATNNTLRDLTSDNGRPRSSASPAEKAEWQSQYDTATRVRKNLMAKIDGFIGGDTPPPAAHAPAAGGARPPISSFFK